jgi:hypothetical protein
VDEADAHHWRRIPGERELLACIASGFDLNSLPVTLRGIVGTRNEIDPRESLSSYEATARARTNRDLAKKVE